MEWLEVIQTIGYPIATALACGAFAYKLVIRDKDEAKEREEKLQQSISENAAALERVSQTIEHSNNVNEALSETNRLLVEKFEDKLNDIDNNVKDILNKVQ